MATLPDDETSKEDWCDQNKTEEAKSLMDMSQTILNLLRDAVPAGTNLLSPLLLAQTSGSTLPAATQLSLPWMLPAQYQQQLMALQQGLTQQLLVPGVRDDGQVVIPVDKTGYHMDPNTDASPLLSAILQRRNQMHEQGTEEMKKNAESMENAHLPNSGLFNMSVGLPLQNMQCEGMGGQTGTWTVASNENKSKQSQVELNQTMIPRPPKKPLTPYMIFSKEIWPQVKAANSHLSSVTEIGAIIGSMWRELRNEKKERFNELFTQDKIRYDEEMSAYLRTNNLRPSDLAKVKMAKRHHGHSSSLGVAKRAANKSVSLGRVGHDALRGSLPSAHQNQIIQQTNFYGQTVFPTSIAVPLNASGQPQIGTSSAAIESEEKPVNMAATGSRNENIESQNRGGEGWVWSHDQMKSLNGKDQTEQMSNGWNEMIRKESKGQQLNRVGHLQMQIIQLESALNEKSQKLDQLKFQLETANQLIEQLKDGQRINKLSYDDRCQDAPF